MICEISTPCVCHLKLKNKRLEIFSLNRWAGQTILLIWDSLLTEKKKTLQKQSPEVLYEKGVLTNFAKFAEKQLCQSLFFNKVAGLKCATLFEKRYFGTYVFCQFYEISKKTFCYRTPLGDCFKTLLKALKREEIWLEINVCISNLKLKIRVWSSRIVKKIEIIWKLLIKNVKTCLWWVASQKVFWKALQKNRKFCFFKCRFLGKNYPE